MKNQILKSSSLVTCLFLSSLALSDQHHAADGITQDNSHGGEVSKAHLEATKVVAELKLQADIAALCVEEWKAADLCRPVVSEACQSIDQDHQTFLIYGRSPVFSDNQKIADEAEEFLPILNAHLYRYIESIKMIKVEKLERGHASEHASANTSHSSLPGKLSKADLRNSEGNPCYDLKVQPHEH